MGANGQGIGIWGLSSEQIEATWPITMGNVAPESAGSGSALTVDVLRERNAKG